MEHARAIGDGVRRALVEAFGVPPGGRFQLVHRHEPGAFAHDPDDLGIPRTDDLVVIESTAGHWRDTDQKERLCRLIAGNLDADPGLRPGDVWPPCRPTRDDRSFGRGLASCVVGA